MANVPSLGYCIECGARYLVAGDDQCTCGGDVVARSEFEPVTINAADLKQLRAHGEVILDGSLIVTSSDCDTLLEHLPDDHTTDS